MKKKIFSISQIKRYFNKKIVAMKLKKNLKDENNIGNITRAFLSSLIIMCFFFISPIIVNYSKNSLTKLLKKK